MFKEILEAWREETFLSGIVKEFLQMVQLGLWMFDRAIECLRGKDNVEKLKSELYAEDKNINKKEQQIRKRLVEHLSINPREDFVACLVFMSIVKDAERIGDYAKNIFELLSILQAPYSDDFAVILFSLSERIKRSLQEVLVAFKEGDFEKAKEIMIRHKDNSSQIEDLIRSLAARTDFPSNKVVAYTLLLRYLKRISSHTANIASAIVNPLEKIDFAVEGELK